MRKLSCLFSASEGKDNSASSDVCGREKLANLQLERVQRAEAADGLGQRAPQLLPAQSKADYSSISTVRRRISAALHAHQDSVQTLCMHAARSKPVDGIARVQDCGNV